MDRPNRNDKHELHNGEIVPMYNNRTYTEALEKYASTLEEAINFNRCCTELPNKETIKIVASNKALKYAYANEDTYKDYAKAIEEGADYVKNFAFNCLQQRTTQIKQSEL